MLQLQTKAFDVCRISKLLAKYNIKASIANQVVTLKGEIPNELLEELCKDMTICHIQNFESETVLSIPQETDERKGDKIVSNPDEEIACAQNMLEGYDLLYPTVKRGEVYLCDFGEPYGSEQGYERHAIVVQNDVGNLNSPTTIVVACTTRKKASLPCHHSFIFSEETMVDYNDSCAGTKQNLVMAEQIRTVDKRRLRKLLGTMNETFMDRMQEILDVSLELQRKEKIVTKTETMYVDKPVYKEVPAATKEPKEYRDVSLVQMQLLSYANINELFQIAQSKSSDKIKAEKLMEQFGFDMQKNGAQYLFQAILVAPKEGYFNLETLCARIAKSEPDADKDEVKRLIVARVKEQFKFKKSPTIDFIRLVNSFLRKEEKSDEENSI